MIMLGWVDMVVAACIIFYLTGELSQDVFTPNDMTLYARNNADI
jgi:hypothetical protein